MDKKTLIWVIIGIVVLVLALGYYFYGSDYRSPGQVEETGDLSDMASEVEAVNLDDLGSELGDIEAELR